MLRVFISGKITGTNDYLERFSRAEQELCERGYEPVNPASVTAQLPKTLTPEEYMTVTLAILTICDAIYMLPGWEDSEGAQQELKMAKMMRMKVMKRRSAMDDEELEIPIQREEDKR